MDECPTVGCRHDGGGSAQPGGQATVEVDSDHPAIADWPLYLDKYRPAVERAFGSIAEFSASYPIALRVRITGVRGFLGDI